MSCLVSHTRLMTRMPLTPQKSKPWDTTRCFMIPICQTRNTSLCMLSHVQSRRSNGSPRQPLKSCRASLFMTQGTPTEAAHLRSNRDNAGVTSYGCEEQEHGRALHATIFRRTQTSCCEKSQFRLYPLSRSFKGSNDPLSSKSLCRRPDL